MRSGGRMTEQRKYPDMWVDPEDDPRTESTPPNEKATYQEYLKNYRLTLSMKCDGLTPEQLATRSVPPSTLSLLGLIRHMAKVEHGWFQRTLQGKVDERRLFWREDERDVDFNEAVGDQHTVDEAFATWREQIAAAEAWLDGVPEDELGREVPIDNGGVVVIRDVLVHMIEEYARHCGHADLLRECIDGRTGQ